VLTVEEGAVPVDRKADELAGAGRIAGVGDEDPVRVMAAPEEVASADLKARTSRDISIQVMSSV
jgi:hypothetical protein